MKLFVISIGIGVVIGVVDILPMILGKMSRRAIISAFLQYFFVSIVVGHISLPGIPWWAVGSIVSCALAIPIVVIVSERESGAVPIILSMSIILGAAISVAFHALA
ncbi:MAG TPA: hypothetical protein VF857_02975 [Spirochaetota bacterium]